MRVAPALVALACVVAAHTLPLPAHARLREERFPVPPIPPARIPLAEAPVPDPDLRGPMEAAPRTRVTLDLTINHRGGPAVGAAYAPGARYKVDDDRKILTLPGIMVRIPFP